MQELLILSASPRRANGDAIAAALCAQLSGTGRSVRVIRLSDWHVRPCNACGFCADNPGRCVLDRLEGEQGGALLDLVAKAAALLVVSPVWFYGPPAQLKALIDRTQCRWEEKKAGNILPQEEKNAPSHQTGQAEPLDTSRADFCATGTPVRPAWNVFTAARAGGERLFEASGLILRCFERQMGFAPQEDLTLRGIDAPDAFLSSADAKTRLSTFCTGLQW